MCGYLDEVPVDCLRDFERSLLRFLHAALREASEGDGRISEETGKAWRSAIDEFKRGYAG